MMTVTANRVPRWCVFAMLVLSLGSCLKKASYFPSEQGGFKLVTSAGNYEKAVIRLRRTAEDLCDGQAYRMSEPEILEQGHHVGWVASTVTSVQAHLTCH